MNKVFTWMKTLMTALLVTASVVVNAQSYPFPQNVDYGRGLKPSGASSTAALAAYQDWKDNFVTTANACGYRRVIFDYYPGTTRGATDKSKTVSEGIGYGMLLSAYAADRTLFDDLWNYYKSKTNGNVMHWQIQNCNVVGANGATDAELDVAMALIVASHQWQSDAYLSDAKNMIRIIREKEVENGSYVLKPGDQFGGSDLTCPSYFSPAYYRVFKDYDAGQGAFWDNVAAKGYAIINAATGASGLVPDWCTSSGAAAGGASGYEDGGKNFIFDGIRTPFRTALDYLWHGNADAKTYCTKVTTWLVANHGSPSQIGSKYGTKLNNNDGQRLSSDKTNTFIGCFAVGIMGTESASAQSFLNSAYTEDVNLSPGTGYYFNSSFKALSLFVMSGNFYLPPPVACAAPELGKDRSLCESASLSLDATVPSASYVWKKNGAVLSGKTSATLAATEAGLYEVNTTVMVGGKACVRRDNVNVYAAAIVADFIAKPVAGGISLVSTSTGGISTYTWTITGAKLANPKTATGSEVIVSGLLDGSYTIKLDVDNKGFGCTGTGTKTKTVVVGAGPGFAYDDFNGLYDKGINLYTYGDKGTEFAPFKKTYCSLADSIAKKAKECDNHKCSLIELVCNGSTVNYATMEFAKISGSYDLSGGAYVAMRVWASAPVTVDVHLGKPATGGTYYSDAQPMVLTTEPQVFNFDFTSVLTGAINGKASLITSWSEASILALRPYTKSLTYKGTIYIDYVIVGANTLPAPTFNVKKDKYGYKDYGNYLPDYYPNDAKYKTCTTSDKTGLCYGSVPDWKRKVTMCGTSVALTANACLAQTINWYKGTTPVGTGDVYTATAPGTYYVDLISAGGITRDTVVVTGGAGIEAAFSYAIEDKGFGARFTNNSVGYNKFVWSYGATTTNPDLAGNTTWKEGYMYYKTEGTYPVKLTVTDTVCNTSKSITKDVVIKCADDTIKFKYLSPTITNKKIKYCGGSPLTVKIDSTHSSYLGWYGFNGALTMGSTETVTFTPTNSGYLKVEAENACKLKSVDSIYIEFTPAAVASIDSVKMLGGTTYGFVAKWVGDSTLATTKYKWSIDGGTAVVTKNNFFKTTFTGGGVKEVCLTVENSCGTPTTKSCKTVSLCAPVLPVGIVQGKNAVCPNEAGVVYTITAQAGMTYSWTVPVGATITTGAATNSITVKFGTTAGKVVAKVTDACATPGFLTSELTVAVGASASPAFNTTLTGKKADFAIKTPDANATYSWMINGTPATGTTATQTFTAPGTYKVKATANTTCGAASDSSTVCIAITANDVSAITASAPEVCAGAANPITYSVSKIEGATYAWTLPAGATKTGTAESISVVYGPTAVSGNVSVSVASTCTTPAISVTSPVLVNKKPAAVFTAPVSGKTVNPSVTTPDAKATYTWSIDGASKTGATTTNTFTLPGTYNVKLTAENTCGVDTSSKNVCIAISSTDLGTITASSSTVCADGKTAVTYSVPVVKGATYTWTVPSGSSKTGTAESISVIYGATAVSGNVSVSVSSACTTPAVSVTSPVMVSKPATATVVANSNGVDGLTATATPAGDVTTYAWTIDNAPVTGTTAKINSVVADGSHSVCVTVSNSVCPASAPVCATVNVKNNCANKVGEIGALTAGGLLACEKSTSTYSIAPVTNATIYTWSVVSGGATISPSGTSAAITFGTTDAVIKLVADNADQCGTKTTQFTVKVGKKPSAAFTLTQDVKLISVSATDLTATSYAWTFGDGNSGTGSNASHTYVDFGNYTVTLAVSSASCPGEVTSTKDVKLAQCSSPIVALTAIEKNITGPVCSGASDLVFTALPASNPNVTSYTWTYPNGTSEVTTTNSVFLLGYENGSGKVTVVAKSACDESTASTTVDMLQTLSSTSVNSPAEFSVVVDEAPTSIATFKVTTPGAGVNYVWTDNGTVFGANDTIVTQSYTKGSVRNFCLKASNSCGAVTKCKNVTINVLGFDDELNDFTTDVFPTVSTSDLTIQLGGKLSGVYDITITNMLGKVVATETMLGASIKDINVSSYASGMYIITIQQGAQRISKRFMKN